jgi:uncharacterized protein YciI
MRYYAITSTEAPNAVDNRLANHMTHIARIHALQEEGRLLIAGAFPAIDSEDPGPAGFSGGVVVAKFPCLDAAKMWAHADPYWQAGVYIKVEVTPFNKVAP